MELIRQIKEAETQAQKIIEQAKPKIVTRHFLVLWVVNLPVGEIESREVGQFTTEEEAQRVADSRDGWYGSPAKVTRKEIEVSDSNPDPYESALDWAKENLSYNEMQKLGFL